MEEEDDDTIIPAPPPANRPRARPRALSPRARNTRCSFCAKPLSEARAMVKSAQAHICDECIVSFRSLVKTPPDTH